MTGSAKGARPGKPAASRKEEQVRIRCTAAQKALLIAAADRAGLEVSSWLRSVGLREAERLLERKKTEIE